ncbi:hypothetical protein LTR36_008887 [Oleoguttula mirabilis]|uniref:F-box domain-containing protein n=1 Tax=Oleoguttula mirabilis TaxID=1507867 RepID=A0AAV9J7Y7_9PEZI|nr:hypothetical protein LTR36_008887 [Oleoguttula mirabilis]
MTMQHEISQRNAQLFVQTQRDLGNIIHSLRQRDGPSDATASRSATFAAAAAKIQEAQDMLLANLTPTIVPFLTSEASALRAEQAFGIPELAEHFLLYLSAHDLNTVQQVNRQLRDVVAQSVKLQHRIGVRADHGSVWGSNFPKDAHKAFSRELEQSRGSYLYSVMGMEQHSVSVLATMRNVGSPPYVGPAYCRLLVCQLPVTDMHVYINCCRPRSTPSGKLD